MLIKKLAVTFLAPWHLTIQAASYLTLVCFKISLPRVICWNKSTFCWNLGSVLDILYFLTWITHLSMASNRWRTTACWIAISTWFCTNISNSITQNKTTTKHVNKENWPHKYAMLEHIFTNFSRLMSMSNHLPGHVDFYLMSLIFIPCKTGKALTRITAEFFQNL